MCEHVKVCQLTSFLKCKKKDFPYNVKKTPFQVSKFAYKKTLHSYTAL